jgi:hypothetical protein
MHKDIRITEAIENKEKNITFLASQTDIELSKKLNLVHIQMELAEKTSNGRSLQILEVWRSQIIEARIYKAENRIPDQPSEIELAVMNIETIIEKSVQREEVLRSSQSELPETTFQENAERPNHSDQLSLF